jgi:hypothetical protein
MVLYRSPRHEDVCESEGIAPCILNHVLDKLESASRPGCFNPGTELPLTIGQEAGWTPEPDWTRCEEQNLRPSRETMSSHAAHSLVTTLTETEWLILESRTASNQRFELKFRDLTATLTESPV